MGDGAFRDASAAIERAAMLEQENETLRGELAEMAKLRVEVEELEKLRAEVTELRAIARTENESAYVKRLGEERDELATEVRELRERLAFFAKEQAELRAMRAKANAPIAVLEPIIDRLSTLFDKKK
jgi:chromosome segregation ATPase